MELCRTGRYTEALTLITEKNPLPFTTGTICAHRCQTKCTRNYYDESVHIRETKLVAAENGYDALMRSLKKPAPVTDGRKAAIIGGGPTGIAAAYFLGRAGIPVTVFEKSSRLGGVPMQVIPGFRISEAAIEKDIALMQFYGAEIRLNTPAPSVAELNVAGYTHIFFAVGAGKAGRLNIPGNVVPVIQWLRDLKAGKRSPWAMWRSSAAAIPRWMQPERRFAQGQRPRRWFTAAQNGICPPMPRNWNWQWPMAFVF